MDDPFCMYGCFSPALGLLGPALGLSGPANLSPFEPIWAHLDPFETIIRHILVPKQTFQSAFQMLSNRISNGFKWF